MNPCKDDHHLYLFSWLSFLCFWHLLPSLSFFSKSWIDLSISFIHFSNIPLDTTHHLNKMNLRPCWYLWLVLPPKAIHMSMVSAAAWSHVDVHELGPYWCECPDLPLEVMNECGMERWGRWTIRAVCALWGEVALKTGLMVTIVRELRSTVEHAIA